MADDAPMAPVTLTALPVLTCPHCDHMVPDAPFCGLCGAHLAHPVVSMAARRPQAYAAFPDESVWRLSVITSLMPQLGHRSKSPFRMTFGLIAALLVILALARLEAPLIAVSALGVPLLFQLYIFEVDPYQSGYVLPTVIMFGLGAGLGVGWALIGGPQVTEALRPQLSLAVTGGLALRAAVAVPIIGQVLMCVPVILLRLGRTGSAEPLDGFTAGVTGALGFTLAATLAELSPLLSEGISTRQPFLGVLTEALIRGVSVPLVAAAATGYVGAALWSPTGGASTAGGRWLASPLPALGVALAIQVGLGFTDVVGLSDSVLLLVHLSAVGLALLVMRIGVHHVLLHEARQTGGVGVGAPRVCPHCQHVVPAMPFCPHCGVAEHATARSQRRPAAPAGDGSVWPTVPSTSPRSGDWCGFPAASRGQVAATRRFGHRRLLVVIAVGLAILSGVLITVAVVSRPTPPPPCIQLTCDAPAGAEPVENVPLVTIPASGISFRAYAASDSQVTSAISPASTSTREQIDYTDSTGGDKTGTLEIEGISPQGLDAQQIVDNIQTQDDPNAVVDYVVPGAWIGYHLGYGVAYHETVNSGAGTAETVEFIIMAAVVHNLAVVILAQGPRDTNLVNYLDHPTPALFYVATFADPVINSIRWPGP